MQYVFAEMVMIKWTERNGQYLVSVPIEDEIIKFLWCCNQFGHPDENEHWSSIGTAYTFYDQESLALFMLRWS